MTQNSPVLSINDLSLSYGEKEVFKNVTFPLFDNTVTALIGPSGCGKSSLLMCLNRLIDHHSSCVRSTGNIFFNNHNTMTLSGNLSFLRKDIGMIFQKPNPFPLSIQRNLELPVKEHLDLNKNETKQLIEETLQRVGLWEEVKDRLNDSATSLSGGQQQRLCIARALILNPKILLMDEPCSALDPISSAIIEDLILDLKKQCSIFVVTHNMSQARRIADYTAFFWYESGAGKLIEYGTTDQVFITPKDPITAAYIQGKSG